MNTRIESIDAELVDDSAQFFAPVASDLIDTLLGRYQSECVKIERIAGLLNGDEYRGAVQYFLDGNSTSDRAYTARRVEDMFALKGAMFSLNARYWADALALTDVYDSMPQARRDYWNAQMRGETHVSSSMRVNEKVAPLPDFEESTVRNTLADLLRQRATFFAERVDGIFQGLSRHHVTNEPQGFSKRMIMDYMLNYGSIRHEKAGLINDLRCVIAKFMGRGEPQYNSSDVLIAKMYACTGEWVNIDGGTLRIRVYKKGTAHLEVHPDMAWRLNQVLSSLYPLTIPAEFRTKPKKQAKAFQMMGRPLPHATLELLAAGVRNRFRDAAADTFAFEYKAKEHKATYADACSVLAALGGTPDRARAPADVWAFDYPIADVLGGVVITGCLPDQKTHQFYETPEVVAEAVIAYAAIQPTDVCLEPSAGQGALAQHLPLDRTVCVEISTLHCAILKARGFKVVQGDFLSLTDSLGMFDLVVTNPPFSEGRAEAHVTAAIQCLKPGGRIVAVMPMGVRNKFSVAGCTLQWPTVFHNAFAGTSVSVAIMVGVKQ